MKTKKSVSLKREPSVRNSLGVVAMTCEDLSNPLGIDVRVPRLGWHLVSAQPNCLQKSYRILVATHPDRLLAETGDLWDSGRVDSEASTQVEYRGQSLPSGARAYWTVKVWDRAGGESEWAPAAWFEMGLLNPEDWTSRWIAIAPEDPSSAHAAPYFRKAFSARSDILSARAYVCGVGYHELYLNGQRVGDHVLDPGFTRYDKRLLYVTHDVTALLSSGRNVAGVILGNGFYNNLQEDVWQFHTAVWKNTPALRMQINVTYRDGTQDVWNTDASWQVNDRGPIVFNSVRCGEKYDARKEFGDWAGRSDSIVGWSLAREVEGPLGRLTAQMMPPIRVLKAIRPVSVKKVAAQTYQFDMGQDIAGWAKLTVKGKAGTEIRLEYGDRRTPDGRIDRSNYEILVKGCEVQVDTYTLKGGGEECWEPRFTYHGFQWVEVTGLPDRPTLDTLCGYVVGTDFERAGSFQCSHPLLNWIQTASEWSYIGNYHSIPTDCPHREKNGWTGDAHLAVEMGLYNYRSLAAYEKWMDDFSDAQREDGNLPAIVPTSGFHWGYDTYNGACWDSAYPLISWALYLYGGDRRVLEKQYDGMKRYVDYLAKLAGTSHLVREGLGEWCAPYGSSADYVAPAALSLTGYYYQMTEIVSRVANLLGRPEDSQTYQDRAELIRKAFNETWLDRPSGIYHTLSMTAQAAALYQGLAEKRDVNKVLEKLVTAVELYDYRINAGIHGTKHLFHALADNGRMEVAYQLATQTQYPSYGWWKKQGANTLWEDWKGSYSHNHIMFGDISAWFYRNLAGIQPDIQQPGFKHILIRPQPAGNLRWVRADHLTPYGAVKVVWRIRKKQFVLEVTVPANTTAQVTLPVKSRQAVLAADGKPVGNKPVYAIGSGTSRYTCRWA
jgi:alpha-L-rhamnosidase